MKERASFGLRLVALVIDVVLLFALSAVLGLMAGSTVALVVHKFVPQHDLSSAVTSGFFGVVIALVVTSLVASLLSLPYNLMEALVGWTPGKLVTGLRVRNQDGSRPSFTQVFARWLIKHNAVLFAILTLTGIPFTLLSPFGQALVFLGCFLALTPARQALHDVATGTAVYEVAQLQEETNDSVL